jgi:hypothetical protein
VIPGVRGHLVSASFASAALRELPGAAAPPPHVAHALDGWSERLDASLGPASGVRVVTEAAVIPLLALLGFHVSSRQDSPGRTLLQAASSSARGVVVPVLVLPGHEPLDREWRRLVVEGIRVDARWGFCCNGTALRIVDAHRTWARRYLEFDLRLVASEPEARMLLWSLARAEAMDAQPPVLDRAAALSERHGVEMRTSLGSGVLHALARLVEALASQQAPRDVDALLEQALTVLYRILFLLFAEARGLVPLWHPVYRARYSIDTIVTTLAAGGRYRGLWRAILAISRLAHAGCTAGTLRVTAFNGRLFAPIHATALERAHIDDAVMSEAVLAVSVRRSRAAGLSRVSYRELDVEQLGAVYERVLEYAPVREGRPNLTRSRDARQASGSFYTPRPVTAWLVRQALEPLVRDRTADEVLDLRVLDPAMGSGAFLVGACRYLADAVEERLVREGRWHPGDATEAERAAVRREVAQRCLFGVDLNPMAVQLARLSLWLATLAADKPLTFLDHHLVAANSLVGATFDDVLRRPGGSGRRARADALPLFDQIDAAPALERGVRTRLQIAHDPDDSAAIVAAKDKTLAALQSSDSPIGRWRALLDLWCAAWFWEDGASPGRALVRELSSRILGRTTDLPEHTSGRLLAHASALAARHRFLHWPLAFPEAFADRHGSPRPDAGFDAVLGNPPWDMVRGDSGEADVRTERRTDARRFITFVRESGVYRVDTAAHLNRYQLFVERALQLTRDGGRLGLVLPSGVLTDAGVAPLRRHLFDRLDIDSLTGFENRAGIFPVHRSVRFVLLTGTAGRPTTATACRFGLRHADDLERAAGSPIVITPSLLSRLSGSDDLGLPDIASQQDLAILDRIAATVPWLGAPDGWGVRFGRELNASDDRGRFAPFSGSADARPIVEGKQIEPFRVSVESSRYELRRDRPGRNVGRRARLAYRDVASATNRLTLIAAVIPSRAVTTHTLFCAKTPLAADAQYVLCALLNSFVANYLIRKRVNTHVTAALVARLPVPVVGTEHAEFRTLARLSERLSTGAGPAESRPEYARLQAIAARLYGLTGSEFAHVLTTFPLIPDEVKRRVLAAFQGTIAP